MAMNPDTELQLLEEEFPESFRALQMKAPRALTNKLIDVARSTALQPAAGRKLEDMALPQYQPTRPGKDRPRPRMSSMLFSRTQAAQRPPADAAQALLSDALASQDIAYRRQRREQGGFRQLDEIGRLQGRDRATWLQRIAELSLQGETERARQLIDAMGR